jgi:hypothetical protein
MGGPTSEVGYTSATNRRGGPRNLEGHVVALGKKKKKKKKEEKEVNWYVMYVLAD